MYSEVREVWKKPRENLGEVLRLRMVGWRREGTVIRIDKPTRLNRARSLGYKAKQGYSIARVMIVKGGRKRPKPAGGRDPHASGRFFSARKSKQTMAEEKAARKYPNLEVLNSYKVGEDGKSMWFECILVDPDSPAIRADGRINWMCAARGRANRGLTSSGKRSRGLLNKGRGTEKLRPSLGAHNRQGN
jgi:large subunit ribosomal protein L15e